MSPSEFDLRAALRDGEGDRVDPDRVIVRADRYRAQRRSRILNTAASVVVVAALGTGGVLAFRGGGTDSGATSSAGKAGSANSPAKADAVGSAGGALRVPGASSAGNALPGVSQPLSVACPAQYPRTLLPTGPATEGPMFAQPVSSVVVCSYGSPVAPTEPVRVVLVGLRATQLAARLERASTTPTPRPCPTTIASRRTALAIIGVTAAGETLPVVTTTVDDAACNLQATNGIAVRYDWKPPPGLLPQLAGLTTDPTGPASPSPPPSGTRASTVR